MFLGQLNFGWKISERVFGLRKYSRSLRNRKDRNCRLNFYFAIFTLILETEFSSAVIEIAFCQLVFASSNFPCFL